MSGPCVTCGRPRNEFPTIFRNDVACSVTCEKSHLRKESAAKAVAPSACSE